MTKCSLAILSCVLLCSCRMDMQDQPKYKPLQSSRFFADGRASRPLPEGTVARGNLRTDRLLYTGRVNTPPGAAPKEPIVPRVAASAAGSEVATFDPSFATQFPFPITREVIERGRNRFEIFCTPCHDYTGSGQGMIVQRGLSKPPSYHTDRLRNAPVGHFFDVITNGYGAMYSYAARVAVKDRWAIIAYIRALQLSHNARIDDVPADQRSTLAPPPGEAQTGPGELQQPGKPPTDQRPREAKPEGEAR